MEAWALKYRPRTFDDLVGQRAVQVILRQMVLTNQVPTALLFDGPKGTGKTTTARILAAALNCEAPPGPCGHCVSCKSVFNGTSLDVIEIDAASNGLVDDMRQLCAQVMYRVSGAYRVVILDEAHSMSPEASNALLKTLEEPPAGTVFLLLTTKPARILDTVISRCMPFTFRRIAVADIAARLSHISQAEKHSVDPDLLTLIAERADGCLRDAVMVFDQVCRAGITTAEKFADLFGAHDRGPDLLGHLATGNLPAAYAVTDEAMSRSGDPTSLVTGLISVLRDILVLHCAGTIVQLGDRLTVRQRLAQQVDTATAMAALRLLWDLRTKARAVDDPRASLDLIVAMLAEVFNRHRQQPEPSAHSAPRKLSLAEMATARR